MRDPLFPYIPLNQSLHHQPAKMFWSKLLDDVEALARVCVGQGVQNSTEESSS